MKPDAPVTNTVCLFSATQNYPEFNLVTCGKKIKAESIGIAVIFHIATFENKVKSILTTVILDGINSFQNVAIQVEIKNFVRLITDNNRLLIWAERQTIVTTALPLMQHGPGLAIETHEPV